MLKLFVDSLDMIFEVCKLANTFTNNLEAIIIKIELICKDDSTRSAE